MSTVSSACSLYRLPLSMGEELEQLRQMTQQFTDGDIPAARYQAFRVPQGIYEQRESGTYMLRVRLPAGQILPDQMRAVAAVAETYGNGTLHLTSRQDIQVHRVPLAGVYPGVKALADAGLSTKGGGGNTVRNIAACPLAGVCPKETFDVTGHVVALTEFMLPDPLSFKLPRKYKIAFSGCAEDCAAATINDLGFIAKQRDGVKGFAVYVAGGMGARSRMSTLFEDFVPESEVHRIAEAIKRVFDQHGNRKNRHHARLRFLLEDIGLPEFRRLYEQQLREIPASTPSSHSDSNEARPGEPTQDTCAQWQRSGTISQKQPGYFAVRISPPLGVLDSAQLRRLASIVEKHGEKMLRATAGQDLVLRWVTPSELAELRQELAEIGLPLDRSASLRNLVACAGAATCRLGICLSRGLATAIASAVSSSGLDLAGATGDVSIHISGCPNACGRHPVAQVGLIGAARRVNGHLVPHYTLQLGGTIGEGRTTLASGSATIPARNVPALVVDLLRAYQDSPQHGDWTAFLDAGGRAAAEALAQKHTPIAPFEQDKNAYFDWDAQEVFSLAGRGPGECGAGVFDLIEVDLASAAEALAAGKLFAATVLAARSLLVTRGEQADTDAQALALFRQHFVEQNLVPASLRPLIEHAIESLTAGNPSVAFAAKAPAREDIAALLEAVKTLYAGMGPSLRLPAAQAPAAACDSGCVCEIKPAQPVTVDHTSDFRGVACPLNYVKTQMALARLKPAQVLAVLLDEQGARNVPVSAAKDGHEVIAVEREASHWRVTIRKNT